MNRRPGAARASARAGASTVIPTADQHPLPEKPALTPRLPPTTREAHTHYATDMFCSSKLKTTPRGGESPPSRDDKAPSTVATSGGVDQPICDQLDHNLAHFKAEAAAIDAAKAKEEDMKA